MAVFHCKMCGGEIELRPDASAARCGHCGTQQTLPKLDTPRRENLYDCAGHFLRCGDFDKADAVCRRILREEPADPEAHWLLALCRYGVVYAEDTVLYRRVPVLRRTRLTPFPDDPDYGAALQFAGAGQRSLYESAAKAIQEAQEKILAAAQRKAPFDVYLCCMETDASGRRTQDSILANNLYQQLSREGLRVFFEHVMLSDRLAEDFEAHRFAALNSAPAMIVLGTRPEHFRDLQVKDIWSRFLALMEDGVPKRLLPVYRDMDRYALPGAFSPLRAWDMNEINFAQELIREIKAPLPPAARRAPSAFAAPAVSPKALAPAAPPAPAVPSAPSAPAVPPADKNAAAGQEFPAAPDTAEEIFAAAGRMQTAVQTPAPAGQTAVVPESMEQRAFAPDPAQGAGLAPHDFSQPRQPEQKVLLSAEAGSLLRRALLFLEDGDWKSADEYCEKVLDLEPECAEGYVGKLMAELHASRPEQLGDYEWPLDGLDNYRKAVRFADQKLRARLETYLEQTRTRIPAHYARARQIMSEAYFNRYQDALRILEKIPDYRDASKMIEFCKKKIAGEDEVDDASGCIMFGCGVIMVPFVLIMVLAIISTIVSELA